VKPSDPGTRPSLWLTLTALACGLAIVMTLPIMLEAGLPARWLPVAAVVAFTAAFTATDWVMRDRRVEKGAFLRRSITSNLVFVSICAVVMAFVLPTEKDEAAPSDPSAGRSVEKVAPPTEDARPVD